MYLQFTETLKFRSEKNTKLAYLSRPRDSDSIRQRYKNRPVALSLFRICLSPSRSICVAIYLNVGTSGHDSDVTEISQQIDERLWEG